MPTVPIVVPIIITGILVGSMIKSPRSKKKRKVAAGSVLSGALNAAYAFVMYEFTPTPTSTFRTFTVRPPSELAFVVSSFVTGLVFVLAVLGIALLYGRVRKGEEEPDLSTEETEESKLTLG
jgi:formate hydrogenlyase subunit 3/multisubunit Na+/H+ antiporter MnhD subunit